MTSRDLALFTYQKKPLTVQAVRVTEENTDAVAAWCQGSVSATKAADGLYLKYIVLYPFSKSFPRVRAGYAIVGNYVFKDIFDEFTTMCPKEFFAHHEPYQPYLPGLDKEK